MEYSTIARETFLSGFNCAQSVIAAFALQFGISREQALRMAAGLGAGINYQGKMCGAVLGAHIILGLKFGIDSPADQAAKENLKKLLESFSERFKQEFGSVECKELLLADISKPEELARLRSENIFHTFCIKLVEKAAAITSELIAGKC